ncbi:hypothetical protein V6N12_036044 [Hibiscus sabdariffa]|uniref:Uncharacterized protein n=1 Tax=Hibiscus sabdariffa TaxID=183260 RepID=A0ABR2EPH7_9ROSI
MVRIRNQSGNPSRPPVTPVNGRHRFAAPPVINVPSSSDSQPPAVPVQQPAAQRGGRRAPTPSPPLSLTYSHHSSDFMMPPQGSTGPSRPRPCQPSPSDSPTFYSMPTMSHSQSMPDAAHSAHSFVSGQEENLEVNSTHVNIEPLQYGIQFMVFQMTSLLDFRILRNNRVPNRRTLLTVGTQNLHLLPRVMRKSNPTMLTKPTTTTDVAKEDAHSLS